ncbi:hypothetical protein AGMMS4957_21770 [Bacteroidia bacterium]|nr:hypothetical protein AGMMS4957_21770 [Bacteroidia bacterium]
MTDFEKNDVQNIVRQTYSDFNPSVLTKISDQLSFLELWHEKTSAFKDVAVFVRQFHQLGATNAANCVLFFELFFGGKGG